MLRLFGRERGLTFDGVANGGALFAQPDHRRGIFALRCRPVEMRHGGRTGETAMVHIPCQHPRSSRFQSRTRAYQRESHCGASSTTTRHLRRHQEEGVEELKNGGTDYRPKGAPLRVNVHDFEDKKLGKVVPYGVYDMSANAGFVSVGITASSRNTRHGVVEVVQKHC